MDLVMGITAASSIILVGLDQTRRFVNDSSSSSEMGL